jgi:hypothetical protein
MCRIAPQAEELSRSQPINGDLEGHTVGASARAKVYPRTGNGIGGLQREPKSLPMQDDLRAANLTGETLVRATMAEVKAAET